MQNRQLLSLSIQNRKFPKIAQQEQHDQRLAMSLHHAMKSGLMSESSGKKEAALVKYDNVAPGAGYSSGGKRVKRAGT